MYNLLAIFIGGGLGSLVRFYLSMQLNVRSDQFPYGTFLSNLISSFLLGVLIAYYIAMPEWKVHYRLFLMTGFCGGFSTFSTFSSEALTMLKDGNMGLAFLYLGTSLLFGLLAIFLGMKAYDFS